jgi:hypothetical protein
MNHPNRPPRNRQKRHGGTRHMAAAQHGPIELYYDSSGWVHDPFNPSSSRPLPQSRGTDENPTSRCDQRLPDPGLGQATSRVRQPSLLRPGVVAVSAPGDTTTRITIRSDGTATTTFIGERLVVEFDTPFGPDPSSTVDGEHGVKGDAPRPRSDAQPDGGYPVETAGWRVLVVRVRQDRSGTPYWQLNTTPATPRVEDASLAAP